MLTEKEMRQALIESAEDMLKFVLHAQKQGVSPDQALGILSWAVTGFRVSHELEDHRRTLNYYAAVQEAQEQVGATLKKYEGEVLL